jgi:hypothetical protein
MRLLVGCICLAVAWMVGRGGVPDLSAGHVIEVKCKAYTGFNDDYQCLEVNRLGAELEIRVNENTQKVQISVLKNDGNYLLKDFLLNKCSVVDTGNWKCTDGDIAEYGMVRHRYYETLSAAGLDINTSSISGLTFWALHYGLLSEQDALKSLRK